MNIYLVERDDADYDEYERFVVCAEDEISARNTHPTGKLEWKTSRWHIWKWVDPSDILKLKVTYLGKAGAHVKPGVVCKTWG